MGGMIRNVILHLHNELPLKADIEALPTAADAGLLCTNLRTLEGRKPISTEYLDSVFLIPYNIIRFIEIPRDAIDQASPSTDRSARQAQLPAEASGVAEHGSVIITPPPSVPWPDEARLAEQQREEEPLERLEPDADLLRRIREA
jgi:hypothetical protein